MCAVVRGGDTSLRWEEGGGYGFRNTVKHEDLDFSLATVRFGWLHGGAVGLGRGRHRAEAGFIQGGNSAQWGVSRSCDGLWK